MFAITPKGIGKPPGARAIAEDWSLTSDETFTVAEGGWAPDLVLSEDGLSLRPKTQIELDAEVAALLVAHLKILARDALLDALLETELLKPDALAAVKEWDLARKQAGIPPD